MQHGLPGRRSVDCMAWPSRLQVGLAHPGHGIADKVFVDGGGGLDVWGDDHSMLL